MSRRARAALFSCAALACAALAATLASGYRSGIESQLGGLRPVVMTRAGLPARQALRPRDAARLLEMRRVPERFVPPDALADLAEAVGRAPAGPIPAGSYLVASQFRAPSGPARPGRELAGPGRRAVEIAVSGAGVLAAPARGREGQRVDVIVTSEPGPGGGPGRTYVAANGVELLALRGADAPAVDDALAPRGSEGWIATLALTREQALRLIQAESFARQVRLIAHSDPGR